MIQTLIQCIQVDYAMATAAAGGSNADGEGTAIGGSAGGTNNQIDADAKIVEQKNLNVIDGSASAEDCESSGKVVEITAVPKIASTSEHGDGAVDGNVDMITGEIFEADCRTECESTKTSGKSVSVSLGLSMRQYDLSVNLVLYL